MGASSDSRVTLERCSLFRGLSTEVVDQIQKMVLERRFAADQTIFEEGQPAVELCILAAGSVELDYTLPNNPNVLVAITRVSPGDVFAWSALAGSERLTARARTLEESYVYSISADELRSFLDTRVDAGYVVMTRLTELVASRLRDTRDQLRWLQSG